MLCCLMNAAVADQFGNFTYIDKGTYIEITDYPTSVSGAIEIPTTIGGKPVTSIAENAFDGCGGLTGVTIPEGMTNIGVYAFRNCTRLSSVTIPTSVKTLSRFNGCSGLTSVIFATPSKVSRIGGWAFTSTYSLSEIHDPFLSDQNRSSCGLR
jgi:hypothetical protein